MVKMGGAQTSHTFLLYTRGTIHTSVEQGRPTAHICGQRDIIHVGNKEESQEAVCVVIQ